MSDEFDPYYEWLQIAPHERPIDHYRLLGLIRFEADPNTIAAAADQRMSYVRSFQTGPRGPYTQRLLNELASARVSLLNPSTKSTYDDFLRGLAAAQLPMARPVAYPLAVQSGQPIPRAIPISAPPVQTSIAAPCPPTVEAAEPLVARRWFPIVVVAAVLMVALAVWAIGGRWMGWRSAGVADSDTADKMHSTDSPDDSTSGEDSQDGTFGERGPVVIAQEGTGEVNFPATVATLHGESLTLDLSGDEPTIKGWSGDEDAVSWEFRVVRPDIFRVEITYAAAEDAQGGKYSIAIGDDEKIADIVATEAGTAFRTDKLFLPVRSNGRHKLVVSTVDRPGSELWTLHSIRFLPPDPGAVKGEK